MRKTQALEILQDFNDWRRGDASEMQSPRLIGIAIDTAIKHLRESIKAGKAAKKKAMRAKPKKNHEPN